MNYEEIFRERGAAYHAAMQQWPDARREEFLLPIERASLMPGNKVLDVPAGGGYLRRYLPATCAWWGHEPTANFFDEPVKNQPLLPLPWPAEFAQAAISISGVHHLSDKQPLFVEIRRVLQSGGRFVLADVHIASAVARFLDEFVGRHNSTGHQGNYLNDHSLEDLAAADFEITSAERVHYHWWFANRVDMGEFCRLLFDIRDIDTEEVIYGIEQYIGTTTANDAIGMNWELYIVTTRRK